MSDAPRYATLRDYLRVLREQRVLIVAVTLLFGAVAFGLAAREQPQYVAEASVLVGDDTQELDLVGTPVAPRETAAERAAITARRIARPDVVAAAAKALRARQPLGALTAAVSARPETDTSLIIVGAQWTDAAFAARLADAVAREAVARTNAGARRRYADAAASVSASLGKLQRRPQDDLTRSLEVERLSRLQSLEQISRPASIVSSASVPAAPVSPRPVRDTLLGLLLGLTIAVLLGFGRDSLDRRLRKVSDIRDELRLPVVGHLRDDALGRTLVTSNGKPALTEADFEAFRIMRTNVDFLDVDSRLTTLAVTSALPEEGKSTVACSLACAYALAGKRTLIVECDLRRPTLAHKLGLGNGPGLSDYLAGEAEPQAVLQPVALPGAQAPLVAIVAGTPSPRPAELLGSQRFGAFLDEVAAAYDVVLLDTSPLLSVVDTLELVPRVDGVVVCVRAQQTTRDQAQAAKAALEHFPARPMGIVVTGVRAGDELDYGYYSYAYAYGAKA
jgi:polysaccharide biosynthesis transport protein